MVGFSPILLYWNIPGAKMFLMLMDFDFDASSFLMMIKTDL